MKREDLFAHPIEILEERRHELRAKLRQISEASQTAGASANVQTFQMFQAQADAVELALNHLRNGDTGARERHAELIETIARREFMIDALSRRLKSAKTERDAAETRANATQIQVNRLEKELEEASQHIQELTYRPSIGEPVFTISTPSDAGQPDQIQRNDQECMTNTTTNPDQHNLPPLQHDIETAAEQYTQHHTQRTDEQAELHKGPGHPDPAILDTKPEHTKRTPNDATEARTPTQTPTKHLHQLQRNRHRPHRQRTPQPSTR